MSNSQIERIEYEAFYNCSSLVSIQLPNTLYTLQNNSFMYYCLELQNITLPPSLYSIYDYVFAYCRNLNINFSTGLRYIYRYAFYSSGIDSIHLPQVYLLSNSSFEKCPRLRDVVIPTSISSLPYSLFRYSALISIKLHSGITSIGESCFEDCKLLFDIKLPSRLNELKTSCFKGCISLEQLDLPSSLSTIGSYCFSGCSMLSSLILPRSLYYVNSYAFSSCSRLANLTILCSGTNYYGCCFSGCTSLRTLIFRPNSNLYENVFYGCSNLYALTFMDGCFIDRYGLSGLSNIKFLRFSSSFSLRSESFSGYYIPFIAYCGTREITKQSYYYYYDNHLYPEIHKIAYYVQVPMSYMNDTFAGRSVNKSLTDNFCYQPKYDDYEPHCDPPLECEKEYFSSNLFFTLGSNLVFHVASK